MISPSAAAWIGMSEGISSPSLRRKSSTNIYHRINLTTGDQEILSSHAAGVKSIVYSPQTKLLISGSWDSTLHVHPLSEPTHLPCTVTLPSKPFSLSLTPT